MFDNLRDDASPFFIDEEDSGQQPETETGVVKKPKRRSGRFLGMTPVQRFFIASMLLIATCMLGIMCLLVTGKIGLM